ncbi:MAG: MBL fold metallo-hydrolase [Peptostreptococcaceae bacterium]|nr:MBL fold metallo-hydrolase [Peptostreptococcaceae bacterium]
MQNGIELSKDIFIYNTGYCLNDIKNALPNQKSKKIKFNSKIIYIKNSKLKNVLIDTGYSNYINELDNIKVKIHNFITPINLIKFDFFKLKPDIIILSHFHIDHIGGLFNYKKIPIICSKEAYLNCLNSRGFNKLKTGFIKELLPSDFDQRVIFIEDLKKVKPFFGFDKVYEYKEFKFINLEGHAKGQYGVVYKDLFYVADAYWQKENLIYNMMPRKLTKIIHDNYEEYEKTLNKLHNIYIKNKYKMVATHD